MLAKPMGTWVKNYGPLAWAILLGVGVPDAWAWQNRKPPVDPGVQPTITPNSVSEPALPETVDLDASGAEIAAACLQAATVTVRVLPGRTEPRKPIANSRDGRDAKDSAALADADLSDEPAQATPASFVTVCSGVSLGERMVVTFCTSPVDSRFRVTFPDGEQSPGELRVIDRYSGLSLLEIDVDDLPGLELCDELPKIGGYILTASGEGIEQPAISQGILAGTDRMPVGLALPPLLQCDVRTTDSSRGAPIVDRQGRLLGVIAKTETGGFSYAVPSRHVKRLLLAKAPGQLVVLRRRLPVLGLKLGAGPNEGQVIVEQVDPNGPAAEAQIEPNDLVVKADGRKVRSAYQIVNLIRRKQPGEVMTFELERDMETRTVEVTLGGGESAPETPAVASPGERARRAKGGEFEGAKIVSKNNQGQTEVDVLDEPGEDEVIDNEIAGLRSKLEMFEQLVGELQEELRQRDEQLARTNEQVKMLMKEVDRLRREMADKKKP